MNPIQASRVPEEDIGRILVIEDDPALRELLAHALRGAGYVVYEAGTGIEALRLFGDLARHEAAEVPDLVVSDIRMPELGGMGVLRTLRELDWAMPVILITAFADAKTQASALGLGATVVLDKPVDLTLLRNVVGNYLEPLRLPLPGRRVQASPPPPQRSSFR